MATLPVRVAPSATPVRLIVAAELAQLSPVPVGAHEVSVVKITRSTMTPASLPAKMTVCEPDVSERLTLVLVEPFW
jgi:hypothetical protein